jgi:hypothetical protein
MSQNDQLKVTALQIADEVFPPAKSIDWLVVRIKNLESQIEDLKKEKGEIDRKIRELENMKGMVDTIIKKSPMKSYNGYKSKITVTQANGGVTIVDEAKVPAKYKKIVQNITWDKRAILNEIKESGVVPDGIEVKKTSWVRYTLSKGSGDAYEH